MRPATAHQLIVPLLAALVACGQDGETGSAEDAGTEAGTAVTASADFGEDFEDRACEHLTEGEVRDIFDVAADVEMSVSGYSPCVYTWDMPIPDQPEITAEFTAGISYVVTVAEDVADAERFYASLSEGASSERMTALAEDAAAAATDDSDLSEERRGQVAEAAEDMFGRELTYAALEGVGDQAAWEETHGSLLVLAGNAVFRTIAQSIYFDMATRRVARDNYPALAAEVARATIE